MTNPCVINSSVCLFGWIWKILSLSRRLFAGLPRGSKWWKIFLRSAKNGNELSKCWKTRCVYPRPLFSESSPLVSGLQLRRVPTKQPRNAHWKYSVFMWSLYPEGISSLSLSHLLKSQILLLIHDNLMNWQTVNQLLHHTTLTLSYPSQKRSLTDSISKIFKKLAMNLKISSKYFFFIWFLWSNSRSNFGSAQKFRLSSKIDHQNY